MPGIIPGNIPGIIPDNIPGAMPGAMPGIMPGIMPCCIGGSTGALAPGITPGNCVVPRAAPSCVGRSTAPGIMPCCIGPPTPIVAAFAPCCDVPGCVGDSTAPVRIACNPCRSCLCIWSRIKFRAASCSCGDWATPDSNPNAAPAPAAPTPLGAGAAFGSFGIWGSGGDFGTVPRGDLGSTALALGTWGRVGTGTGESARPPVGAGTADAP